MAFGGLRGSLTGSAVSITNPQTATGSVAVVQGDLVFFVIAEQTSLTSGAVTDNLGHTYTALSAGTTSGSATCRAYYRRITTPGTLTTISAVATASGDNVACAAAVIEGPFRTPGIDQNISQITTDITSPFTCPITGTLSQASEVIIAWGTANYGTVWTATSPNLLAIDQASAALAKVAIGYQVVSATTAVQPVFAAAGNPSNAILGTASFTQDYPLRPLIWPVPRGATPSIELRTAHFVRPAAVATDPALPSYTWSVPEGPRFPISLRTWTTRQTTGSIQGPLNTILWPNPVIVRRGQWPSVLSTPTPMLVQGGPVTGVLPSYTWAVPTGPEWAKYSLGWYNNVVGPIPPFAGPLPLNKYDWPNPQRNDPTLELLTTLNGGIDAIKPFNQQDWPNPIRVRRSSDLSTTAVMTKAIPSPPFHQTNWPNPQPPLQIRRYHVKGLQPQAIQVPLLPFDWPNPQRPRRKPALYQFYQSDIRLHPFVALPLNQYNWPNPQLPRRVITSYVFNDWTLPTPAIPPVKPHAQNYWPVPRGARRPMELYGINVRFSPANPAPPPVPGVVNINNPFIGSMGVMMVR